MVSGMIMEYLVENSLRLVTYLHVSCTFLLARNGRSRPWMKAAGMHSYATSFVVSKCAFAAGLMPDGGEERSPSRYAMDQKSNDSDNMAAPLQA